MLLSPPNVYVEILTLKVMVFKGGASGRQWGHKSGELTNGMSSLDKRDFRELSNPLSATK